MKSLRLGLAVALAALLLMTVVAMAAGITRFDRVLIRDLTVIGDTAVGGAVTGNTVAADTTVASGTTVSAGTSVSAATYVQAGSYAKVTTFLDLAPVTTVAVGAGGIITPTGSNQPITSTAGVTTSTSTAVADGARAGDMLILRNANASDTITIDGTGGNVECKTDKVLGAQDTLMLLWNGSNWVCIGGHSDNS